MPKFRTGVYANWRACERLGLFPPGVKPSFSDNDVSTQEMILAYNQIREYEDAQLQSLSISARL